MAKEDKFADEMLTDDELDNVNGGTRMETALVNSAFHELHYGQKVAIDISDALTNNLNKAKVETFLKHYFGSALTFNIDVGENGTGVGEKANEYYLNGVKCDTSVILAAINNTIIEKQKKA